MDFTKVEFVFKSTRILWELRNLKLLANIIFGKKFFLIFHTNKLETG